MPITTTNKQAAIDCLNRAGAKLAIASRDPKISWQSEAVMITVAEATRYLQMHQYKMAIALGNTAQLALKGSRDENLKIAHELLRDAINPLEQQLVTDTLDFLFT